MGYEMSYTGRIVIDPPLNEHELAYLLRFASSPRLARTLGPYYCGSHDESDVLEAFPPAGQPETTCRVLPTADGTALECPSEYAHAEECWMAYLSATFLRPGAQLQGELREPVAGRYYAPEFVHFTFDHRLNGVIDAQAGDPEDFSRLIVEDGEVYVERDGRRRHIADTGAVRPLVQVQLSGGPEDGAALQIPISALAVGYVTSSGTVYRQNLEASRAAVRIVLSPVTDA